MPSRRCADPREVPEQGRRIRHGVPEPAAGLPLRRSVGASFISRSSERDIFACAPVPPAYRSKTDAAGLPLSFAGASSKAVGHHRIKLVAVALRVETATGSTRRRCRVPFAGTVGTPQSRPQALTRPPALADLRYCRRDVFSAYRAQHEIIN